MYQLLFLSLLCGGLALSGCNTGKQATENGNGLTATPQQL